MEAIAGAKAHAKSSLATLRGLAMMARALFALRGLRVGKNAV
jgi:hypothetical protein